MTGSGVRWRYLRGTFTWWFGLIWAAVGTPFAVIAAVIALHEARYADEAVPVQATVVEKGHDTDLERSSTYWLRYRYLDAAGAEHVGRENVSWEVWRRYRDGDVLAAEYLRGDPASSRLAEGGASRWLLPLIFGAAGLVFGGTGWFLVARASRRAGRYARLMGEGSPALGKVLAVEVQQSVRINGRHPSYLVYEFTDDLGQKRHGESSYLPRELEERWQPGGAVLVLYDPNDPTRFDVDLFDARPDALEDLLRRQPRT
jgi:hypothetical protein